MNVSNKDRKQVKQIYIPHWLDSMEPLCVTIAIRQMHLHSTLVRFYVLEKKKAILADENLHSTLVRFYGK